MISEKHSAAARANGARSRGPVTDEGKAISSRNAMRHGLLARVVVLPNEDETVFEELFYVNVNRFSPVDDVEMTMVEDMTAACWRLRRCMAIEKTILQAGIEASGEEEPPAQTAAAFCDPARAVNLTRLERYQARLQNTYQRALRGLIQLRKMQPRSTPPVPNEPSRPNVCNTDPAPPPAPQPPAEPQTAAGPVITAPEPPPAPELASDLLSELRFTRFGSLVFP
jgi:hypothetical protein